MPSENEPPVPVPPVRFRRHHETLFVPLPAAASSGAMYCASPKNSALGCSVGLTSEFWTWMRLYARFPPWPWAWYGYC